MPIISVIMPVYNAEKTLRHSIESVRMQTFTNFELILVDDGSIDTSGEICDSYSKLDSRIKVIHCKNFGTGTARNIGLSQANGDYIAFIDSDDIYLTNLLEENYLLAKEYDADMVKFFHLSKDIKTIDFDQIKKEKYKLDKSRLIIMNKYQMIEHYTTIVEKFYLVFVWDALFKRKSLLNNKIFFDVNFKKINEDGAFCMQCFQNSNIVIINPQVYYIYVESSESLSKKFSEQYIHDTERLIEYEKSLLRALKIENQSLWTERITSYVLFIIKCIKNPQASWTYIEKIAILDRFRKNHSQQIIGKCHKIKLKNQFYIWCFKKGYLKELVFFISIDRYIKLFGKVIR